VIDVGFRAMGTQVRLIAAPGAPVAAARRELDELAARLTRFDPASELCALNADPRAVVPASAALRAAVRAALAGAILTRGLADPTLLGAVERAGYMRSRTGAAAADLHTALAAAPARHAARPATAARWREVVVEDRAGTITRPPGVRIDLGGSAKGLIADRLTARLAPAGSCVVDCGGDLRISGRREVHVLDPFTGSPAAVLDVRDGAVATSGLGTRLWWRDGRPAHHLLDPATGEPAWTGVVAATALARTAIEAEALAKAALLAGPAAGRTLLRRHGGVLIADDGRVETYGAAARRRTAIRRSDLARHRRAPRADRVAA
jgi:thiamine biosynthesis lipoprotein